MSSMDTSNLTREKLTAMFNEDKRFDGRKLLDMRDFEVEYGVSNMAEGSARVKMGKTEVIVGIKMGTGEPYPDSQDAGNLMVSGDLLPLASPRFESGPPKFPAIELPRLMDRMIRESGMIDLKKLVIKEGEKVWTVIVDIYPINDDGSLMDAASIGCVAALHNAKFPGLTEDDRADYKNRTDKKLPLSGETMPVSFTFYKLGDNLILNPTREEEEACDTKVTFGISKWNGKYMVNSCQKGEETVFKRAELERIMEILPGKYEDVMKKLKSYIK
ncbi:RNA-binding protein [Candidatus Pacearchaeota archaeon CG10_big_fil_rev_8_21_14_0_10_35_219]|nr:exosome complex protein Rrp42 [Candidatus Pacearchaeota archaeon]OIO43421.1 MAG: hypothetical protein AUJ63_00840 [Candidatus Pacearchaeota archaeon CG1_02_35_32]PIO08065.1 MAG: RNA-binding protein [Candidatus Pacearchaeota archaeon CG10_big_fil_rev_8_21_14_0_10_35_219]PIY81578.1 MAG: RNA-binding protein [Candidatus Pacearchaeota archaeon CG_4_10_14_0_8_um_filter_35_169]PIZ78953.1 MAG: RNA-binding protein [Candidatus Pacearchaeota archaeon CG_4_10_14_0_2_um_filter_35_33]PJA69750.1 MAG: RNA-